VQGLYLEDVENLGIFWEIEREVINRAVCCTFENYKPPSHSLKSGLLDVFYETAAYNCPLNRFSWNECVSKWLLNINGPYGNNSPVIIIASVYCPCRYYGPIKHNYTESIGRKYWISVEILMKFNNTPFDVWKSCVQFTELQMVEENSMHSSFMWNNPWYKRIIYW
jgi:hypothetical protein